MLSVLGPAPVSLLYIAAFSRPEFTFLANPKSWEFWEYITRRASFNWWLMGVRCPQLPCPSGSTSSDLLCRTKPNLSLLGLCLISYPYLLSFHSGPTSLFSYWVFLEHFLINGSLSHEFSFLEMILRYLTPGSQQHCSTVKEEGSMREGSRDSSGRVLQSQYRQGNDIP